MADETVNSDSGATTRAVIIGQYLVAKAHGPKPQRPGSCTQHRKGNAELKFYPRVLQEHWLHDKQDEGKALILNDDSIWEVDPKDQFLTKLWLRGSTIIVEYTEKQAYPYLLRNHTEGEVARANYLGEFRAVS